MTNGTTTKDESCKTEQTYSIDVSKSVGRSKYLVLTQAGAVHSAWSTYQDAIETVRDLNRLVKRDVTRSVI